MGLDERFEMKMAKRRGEECGGNRLFKFVQGEGRGTGRVSRGLARWKFNGSGSIFAWMPIDAAICETLLKKVGRGRVESRGGCDWSMGEEIRVVPFSSLGRKDCANFLLLSLSSGRVMQSVSLVIARQILKFPFQYEISKNLFFFDN